MVRPGEMLLVLGKPGSGCSSFLRTTANRPGLSLEGQLHFSGISHEEFYRNYRRETIYLPEEDNHISSLTVRQTLEFALRMSLHSRGRGEQIKSLAPTLASMFGLEEALDRAVGGGPIPGISGGERKRVSIAEILASASLECFDNSTKALDSSTALDFVNSLRTLTDAGQKTTLATLYQAAYFEEIGFVCEPGQTTSEFLTSVTDPGQRRIRGNTVAATVKTANDLAQLFRQSAAFKILKEELDTYEHVGASSNLVPRSTINHSYPVQILECLRREFQLVNGKRKIHYQKWINTVVLCLIIGSEYFDVSADAQGAFTREGIIFYAIIANAWMQYPELFDAHTNRPVLERQSSVNMYRKSAVAVARIIIDIPLIAVQHAWFMLAFYFLTHHSVQYTAGDFFFFYLVLWLSTLTFANLLRMFAYYVPNIEDCFRFGGIASTTTVYFAGFLIPVAKMKPVWSWLHDIGPPRYTYEALIANDFRAVNLTCSKNLIPRSTTGSTANQVCPIRGAKPGQEYVPGLQYIESFGHKYSHRWRNVGLLFAFSLTYMLVGIIGSETMQFASQGASTIVFAKERKKKSSPISRNNDVERSAAIVTPNSEKLGADVGSEHYLTGPSLTWNTLTLHIGDKKVLEDISGVPNRT
ncbi:ABC-2 type transporter-domain-containing protein [Clohesyomyces aquaticus]|uniref:ABC-2 type transporter-domain-containing protein n=1 Tax=Clohesyomyces aquaticus TaxID=1231657 RepID=A0A1Y1YLS9_9PLEO|nr:ABC-2 type transporter-domain-containing protein [Clohesyomyces aquaticus]